MKAARRVLEEALASNRNASGNAILQLCYSDICGQCGDIGAALQGYEKVALRGEMNNGVLRSPLPFVHVARLYVQVSQFELAKQQLETARRVDPSFANTAVEMSQLYIQQRLHHRQDEEEYHAFSELIDSEIRRALHLAMHYSDIREALTVKLSGEIHDRIAKKGF